MSRRRSVMDIEADELARIIQQCYENTLDNDGGMVADYIPQLACVNPDLYGVSFCDVNGRCINIGDTKQSFCLQSASKPLSYCLARENEKEAGAVVHEHVGYEPSGRAFNEFVLNRDGLPHNPLINAGAIMVSSLIQPKAEQAHRFEAVQKYFTRLGGNRPGIGFENAVFLSEKHHADRNISLAYYMRENNAFEGYPTASELQDHLDLYFQSCSITCNAEMAAVMASTLANSGMCPITQERVVQPNITKDCLSIMYTCGMYDFSGQFSFEIGLPAKSGVSGCILLCVPNVGGFCLWSPRLDIMGNSVRGVQFCEEFTRLTDSRFHMFNRISNAGLASEAEPILSEDVYVSRLIHSSTTAEVADFKKLVESTALILDKEGEEPRDALSRVASMGDYDKRTPLHLAAAEGKAEIVDYIVSLGVDPNPKDRWGNTPFFEASKMLAQLQDTASESSITSSNVNPGTGDITAYIRIMETLEFHVLSISGHGFSKNGKYANNMTRPRGNSGGQASNHGHAQAAALSKMSSTNKTTAQSSVAAAILPKVPDNDTSGSKHAQEAQAVTPNVANVTSSASDSTPMRPKEVLGQ